MGSLESSGPPLMDIDEQKCGISIPILRVIDNHCILSSFTAAGRLQCRIDAVAGCVVTGAGRGADADRSQLYQATIREGDLLLNRVKKLASVINF